MGGKGKMRKTNITDLIGIYHACKHEQRDKQTTLEQLQGEIFVDCKNISIAREIGTAALEEFEKYPQILSSQRRRIDAILLLHYDTYLRSSYSN
jgi:hypothetical protein